ncbi:hypothetical protein RRG08_057832 [Elysia crispata]|uniref:Uncharacterized protein n=1 Tax=Elysia crispata TaxID=231223 RepID=A0AAE1B097_9GAST|nr:hypothetical protein RRG08_057832 [Elysia crispata]
MGAEHWNKFGWQRPQNVKQRRPPVCSVADNMESSCGSKARLRSELLWPRTLLENVEVRRFKQCDRPLGRELDQVLNKFQIDTELCA